MSALRLACLSCALLVSAAAAGSPAGAAKQRIVFLGGPPAAFELFIADASGQHEHPLLPAGPAGYNPSFTADGKWLAFTSERGGSPDIYRVHPDGSGLEQLTDAPGFDDQGALSPDGRTLAFVSTRDTGNANVWLLDIARHRYFNLTHDSHGNFRPSWSPDGRWLAFSSDRDGPHGRSGADRAPPAGSGCCGWELLQFTALYIIHPDGSGLRRLTPVGQVAGSPRWAPDGRHIVYYFDARTLTQYQSKAAGASQIRTIDIDTGTTADLTSGAQNKGAPAYLAATRIGYLIAQGAQAVGFALVTRPRVPRRGEAPVDYCLSEFFVRQAHRCVGIGRQAAMLIFDRFAGAWEVLEYERNRGSVQFWRRVLSAYTGGEFVERSQDGQIRQRFNSRTRLK